MMDAVQPDKGCPEPADPFATDPSSGGAMSTGPADRRVYVLDSEAWAAISGFLEPTERDLAGLRALLSTATVLS